MALTKTTVGVTNISSLSSTPNSTEGLTAAQLQAKFDKTGSDLKIYINDTLTVEQDAINADIESRLSTEEGNIDLLQTGWLSAGETWTYSSVDDPTGVITISGNVTTKYSVGMRIKFTNGGNIIYGIITAVAYSAPNTLLTFLHEIDPADSLALYLMANSAITANYYSSMKAPYGFPMCKPSWTRMYTNTGDATTGSVASSATITNWTNHLLVVPIGCWDLSFKCHGAVNVSSVASIQHTIGLSTANNSFSDAELKASSTNISAALTDVSSPFYVTKTLTLASKTTYYLNSNCNKANATQYCVGSTSTTIIKASCAYL